MPKNKKTIKKVKLIKLENKRQIIKFLQEPTIKIAETLTGILASPMSDWKLSAGKLLQSAIKVNLFTQLGKEFQYYSDKGKIKEDYLATNKNRMSLHELLRFIDEEIPDEERFNAIKSIFFKSISKKATKKDEILAYEFMQICKKLSSGEILTLKSVYDVVNGKFKKGVLKPDLNITQADSWFKTIAKQVGHGISELIEQQEEHLINLKLITKRNQPHNFNTPQNTFEKSGYFRITSLGYELCEFITKYEKIKKINNIYIYQKIQKAVNKYFNKGDLVTCSQIVSVTRKEYPEVKKSCILPSDYCGNHKNRDPWSGKHKIFHKAGRGIYKIL